MAVVIVIIVILALVAFISQAQAAARQRHESMIVCPHCQTAGQVTTSPVKVKAKGRMSRGAATGAFLTSGASLIGGRSRQVATEATCANCGTHWQLQPS